MSLGREFMYHLMSQELDDEPHQDSHQSSDAGSSTDRAQQKGEQAPSARQDHPPTR
jgi:hypothetical protein